MVASTYPTGHLGWWPRGEMAMNGLTRFVATLAIVLALQLGQSTQTLADPCADCDNPCSADCVWDPNDVTWE